MARIKTDQKIERRRTEEEMRAALMDIRLKKVVLGDESDIVLRDCIEELLEARATIEKVKNYVQIWLADIHI